MNQDFIRKLRAHVGQQESDPITDRHSHLCTTIEGTRSRTGESFWIQLNGGMINFRHVDSPEKDAVLGEILDAIDPPGEVELETGTFVTFEVSRLEAPVLDSLMLRLLRDYFEAEESDDIQLATETL